MKRFRLYQVDAFAERCFEGNPAAIVPLETWLDDVMLQSIAAENNVAETAYYVRKSAGRYGLRWFTPTVEVPLCGHATLATSHILWTEEEETSERLTFETLSGDLIVERKGDGYRLTFPASSVAPIDAPEGLAEALGARPLMVLSGNCLVARFGTQEEIASLTPDMKALAALSLGTDRPSEKICVIVTAPGEGDIDFVSRFFGPSIGIDEDQVTGSAHCMLVPYWAAELGKNTFRARQISARGGNLLCTLEGEQVLLEGKCVTYLRGEIVI